MEAVQRFQALIPTCFEGTHGWVGGKLQQCRLLNEFVSADASMDQPPHIPNKTGTTTSVNSTSKTNYV
ncbi:unnamed protein product [Phytophthora lilii]|uniref:Unnamed protein product n=1 Tax=Phytophthora lilii TaxID=2077276 RepID=A0A9W6TDQ4_9STRA|nr:unnamed protein product [Phytophthora lilii]